MQKTFYKKPITFFQKKVYEIVKRIPKGKVLTYKKIAKLAGKPRAWRAVGNILNKNPNPKIIPCHRVIKSNGEIGGYKDGTKKKISLLKSEHITSYVLWKEGIIIKNGKITS